VLVSAVNIAFEQTAISAPAGVPFVIHFVNKDAGIPHNVEIKDASSMTMFKGDVISGPAQADYQVPALAAGTYTFNCTVHPNMTGTLTVGP
jgi:plastocyanin